MTLRLSGRCWLEEGWKARTRYLDIAKVSAATIFCDATVAQGMQLVFELPECVALEIEACGVLGQGVL
jgi:hypothetical protein